MAKPLKRRRVTPKKRTPNKQVKKDKGSISSYDSRGGYCS